MKNKTWDVVARPSGRKVIDGRWVFKIKRDQDGRVARYKARYVARGYTQVEGIDFADTNSPVCSTDGHRVLLAKAAAEDLFSYQLDIETSFQHQQVKEELYVDLFEGLVYPPGTSQGTHCGRLRKALYGLKQAAFELHDKLSSVLTVGNSTVSAEDITMSQGNLTQ